ncbi:MAG: AbrB/MazE/SpoVT family DNA-binding domain-containing protein [Polyangiaceae bacterium]
MRARVSSKGQLVLPKAIRRSRHLVPGSEVEVEEVPGGVLLKLVRGPQQASIDDLLGCTGYRGPTRTLQDMERAIAIGARARR